MKPSYILICALLSIPGTTSRGAEAQVLGWNNLGMHCMDSDYSVFSILPPYNTIEAQLIVGGALVTASNGYTVTYQAVADPEGSFNSTAVGKGNYDAYMTALYGATLPPEMGLAGWAMPGTNNVPQAMLFEVTNQPAPVSAPNVLTEVNWFRAEGIPLTPYDDAGNKNAYPLMRLIAKDGATPIATNDIVLPVSDEMDCRACHASGTQAAAEPAAGWVWAANPERDYRLNILRLHDEQNFAQHHDLYVAALADRGYNPLGLYRGVVADGRPVLCANCHSSEALGTPSYGTIPQLTTSIHSKHASVMDPDLNIALDNSTHRTACYRCHPGSATKCLRGAMGGAIADDGSMSMQCQSCHGNMSQVGSAARVGWFMEPSCQGCHTGTATSNSGQIRYTSVFTDTNWTPRVPMDPTFATQPDTPAEGLSLYRFSAGHGGLQCSACHGSTHAEFPATHRNDNLRNERIQGHAGVMVECTSCHAGTAMPVNSTTAHNGPHGMHPVGQTWANEHHDFIGSLANCRTCHGADYRGTELSRAQTSRNITVNRDGTIVAFPMYKGAEIGCYNCHNGPAQSSANTSPLPVATSFTTNTLNSEPLTFSLPVSGTGAVGRVTGQPEHGSVGVSNNIATYHPEPGYVGPDTFTFAAYNGAKNSLLATGTVNVAQGPFSIAAAAHVPPQWPAGLEVPFAVVPQPVNASGNVTCEWNFGDGTPPATNLFPTHVYAPGNYQWQVISSVTLAAGTASTTNNGSILITAPLLVSTALEPQGLILSWPQYPGDALLEGSARLDPPTWEVMTNAPVVVGGTVRVTMPIAGDTMFYRLKPL